MSSCAFAFFASQIVLVILNFLLFGSPYILVLRVLLIAFFVQSAIAPLLQVIAAAAAANIILVTSIVLGILPSLPYFKARPRQGILMALAGYVAHSFASPQPTFDPKRTAKEIQKVVEQINITPQKISQIVQRSKSLKCMHGLRALSLLIVVGIVVGKYGRLPNKT
jgi:hypothetical protein